MRSPMFYKPNIWRRILVAVAITAGAIAIIFIANFFASMYFNYRDRVRVSDDPSVAPLNLEFDPGITYKNAVNDSALYFFSAENVKIVDTDGKLAADVSLKMYNPTVALKESYALFYDVGGHDTVTFNGTKEISSLKVEETILLASVSSSGYAIIVTEGDLHKCAVRVFTPDGKEIFKWNSGNLSVVGADISNNCKDITVAAINTDEGKIKTHIIMFNIAKEKPFTNDIYDGKLYAGIRYSGGYTYCIGKDDTLIYNSYGKCCGTADYTGRELLEYTLDDDVLALAFSGSEEISGATAEIKTFNHRGDVLGSFTCQQEFDFFDSADGAIAVNDGRTISILNNRCRERLQINLKIDLRDFAFFGSQTRGVGITASGAELIQLTV
ncbi:MAG: hypothetical protein E7393_00905 [Ruminococcaceae bacterium]|nr:hypothetical protein [Oscillospiraceae bacterium]